MYARHAEFGCQARSGALQPQDPRAPGATALRVQRGPSRFGVECAQGVVNQETRTRRMREKFRGRIQL